LRLAGAAVLGLMIATSLMGTAWDIQWHPAVGRDRALTTPHVLLLAGIFGSGVLSLALILLDTWRAGRGRGVDADNSTPMFRVFHAPVGLAVTGFGALLAAIGFPLDDYWHTLYGVDVTLWAPFHVMMITAGLMICLGTLYLLASELNRMEPGRARTLTAGGFLTVLALTLGEGLLLLVQADWIEGLANIGSYQFVLYPIMVAFAVPIALIAAVRVTRLPGAATVLALVFEAVRGAMFLFVPAAMDWGVRSEGLSYRSVIPQEVLTPFAYPGTLLLAGLIVDGAFLLLRRRAADGGPALLAVGGAAAVLITLLDQPWAKILPASVYPGMDPGQMTLQTLPLTLLFAAIGAGLGLLVSRGLEAVRQ
jgi:hypothetical protein